MYHFKQLEFDLYKDLVVENFISEFSKEYFSNLKPFSNEKLVKEKQKFFEEVLNYLSVEEFEPFLDKDYKNFYSNLMDPYKSFSINDLLSFKNFHVWLADLKKKLISSKKIEKLKNILGNIYTFSDITGDITAKISDNGKVKTEATEKLFQIRHDLIDVSRKINKILNSILYGKSSDKFVQEKNITERNDRFVIPCKSNFRQFIKGIVHDVSKSAQTFFVEPAEVVELNNLYQSLRIAEDEEIRRIVYELINSIKEKRYELSLTISAYRELIFYFEYGRFISDKDFVFPDIDDEMVFRKIHHPIILINKKNDSVPIDFIFEEEKKLVVISGPNTGGKTAALKSIGLNHLLGMSGLPLFGQYAKIKMFKNILADIGDNQSLVMDLSTFSAHLMNIKEIVDVADSRSLVLLDELGTGTEPVEGAVFAVSILEYLIEKNAKIVVTTHFKEVKKFAVENEFAEIYAVDFDYEKFSPKYSLLKGVIGKSDPILIAKRLNFNEKIVNNAEEKLRKAKSKAEYELEKLNEMKIELEVLKKSLELKSKELEEKEKLLMNKEESLNKRLEKKEEELLEEAFTLLQRGKNIIRGKLKEKDLENINKDLEKVKNKLNSLQQKKKPVEGIKVGDRILLEKYNKVAEILEIKKDTVYVNLEGIKVELKKKDLIGKKLRPEKEKDGDKKLDVRKKVDKKVSYEINVIGKIVDDAIFEIDKFLDKCVLAGINSAVIIHGRGTGALRKGIREYLRNDQRVKSYRSGTFHEGGDAVTIVEF